MSENKFKKLLAEAMIVGALGFSSLGAGGGIANAKPHWPGIPWIPGPGHVGGWHPGKWLDVGDWVDVGDWIPPWWWFVPPPPPPPGYYPGYPGYPPPPPPGYYPGPGYPGYAAGWQPGEVAQDWAPWGWGLWQGDQGENEQ